MAKVAIYRAEVDLENYRSQAMTQLKFYNLNQKNYYEIPVKIDTGSSITLFRKILLQDLGITFCAINNEVEAVATNGGRFYVQQVQLNGTLEIGKIRIINPRIYITNPQTEQETKMDGTRSNLLGFDLLSCCAAFNISMPANFKAMTCLFQFRSDRLEKYCTSIQVPDIYVDELDLDAFGFDYTEWQRNLFKGMSLDELLKKTTEYQKRIKSTLPN